MRLEKDMFHINRCLLEIDFNSLWHQNNETDHGNLMSTISVQLQGDRSSMFKLG